MPQAFDSHLPNMQSISIYRLPVSQKKEHEMHAATVFWLKSVIWLAWVLWESVLWESVRGSGFEGVGSREWVRGSWSGVGWELDTAAW